MRKIEVLVMVLCCLFVTAIFQVPNRLATAQGPLQTFNSPWYEVRASGNEDAANFATVYNLDGDEGGWASKGSTAFHVPSFYAGRKWMFVIGGEPTNGDNDTFSFNVVGWAKTNGMLHNICEGDGVLGTQDVVIYPDGTASSAGLWADTINLDEQTKWPSYDGTTGVSQAGAAVFNSGDNEICLLVLDLAGLEFIQFVFYDAGDTGDEIDEATVFGRPF